MSLDSALWYAGLSLETAIVVILLQRRIFRALPVFFIYTVWTAVGDLLGVLTQHINNSPQTYFRFFLVVTAIDSLLQFGVIVELAWSVLRPIRTGVPRKMFFIVVGVTLLAGLAAWPLTAITVPQDIATAYRLLYRLMQTFAILRILFFFVLAGFSHLVGVGWRDRELQVATGLGLYSLVSFGSATLHIEFPKLFHYNSLNRIVAASYLVSLLYWGFSFLQKEAQRHEFDPRMQNLLLTVAGAARTNRVALEELRKGPRP